MYPFPDRGKLWTDIRDGGLAELDVLVIGGGITGAGVLREATRRGYRCLLVEQRDFSWGTSSRSSKMVHGGLRYLASGNFTLTRHALQERERLISEAPRLVERLGYHFPLYRRHFPPRFAAGLLFWIYDRIAGIRDHYRVSNQDLEKIFPQLDTSKLNGGFYYTDAVTDDARLTLRVLHEAVDEGASVRNYTRATSLLEPDGCVLGAELEDVESGQTQTVKARVVINATGAWANRLGEEPERGLTIRPQRGSHIVLPATRFPVANAIFLLHPEDGRRLFIYPWEGATIIGTTDIHHPEELDTAASINPQELKYLLTAAAQLYRKNPPQSADVISSWSGVRPIITSAHSTDPSKASREHKVWVEPGMVSCSGGKLTTFHHMAMDVMEKALPFLPPAGPEQHMRIFREVREKGKDILPENPDWGEKLLGRYGEAAVAMLDSASDSEKLPLAGIPVCLAELRWAIENESVVHLDDLMLRRSRLGILLENGGTRLLPEVRQLFAATQGWSDERWSQEQQRYQQVIERYYTVPRT